jgi:hypothetical protein
MARGWKINSQKVVLTNSGTLQPNILKHAKKEEVSIQI